MIHMKPLSTSVMILLLTFTSASVAKPHDSKLEGHLSTIDLLSDKIQTLKDVEILTLLTHPTRDDQIHLKEILKDTPSNLPVRIIRRGTTIHIKTGNKQHHFEILNASKDELLLQGKKITLGTNTLRNQIQEIAKALAPQSSHFRLQTPWRLFASGETALALIDKYPSPPYIPLTILAAYQIGKEKMRSLLETLGFMKPKGDGTPPNVEVTCPNSKKEDMGFEGIRYTRHHKISEAHTNEQSPVAADNKPPRTIHKVVFVGNKPNYLLQIEEKWDSRTNAYVAVKDPKKQKYSVKQSGKDANWTFAPPVKKNAPSGMLELLETLYNKCHSDPDYIKAFQDLMNGPTSSKAPSSSTRPSTQPSGQVH